MELILELYFRQVNTVIFLLLDIDNVFDEMFDVKEGSEVWIF